MKGFKWFQTLVRFGCFRVFKCDLHMSHAICIAFVTEFGDCPYFSICLAASYFIILIIMNCPQQYFRVQFSYRDPLTPKLWKLYHHGYGPMAINITPTAPPAPGPMAPWPHEVTVSPKGEGWCRAARWRWDSSAWTFQVAMGKSWADLGQVIIISCSFSPKPSPSLIIQVPCSLACLSRHAGSETSRLGLGALGGLGGLGWLKHVETL